MTLVMKHPPKEHLLKKHIQRTVLWLYMFCCSAFVPTLLAQSQPLRVVPNTAFGVGEELHYNVGYQFVPAGTGSFIIAPETVRHRGAECLDVRFEVQSLPRLDWLYKLRNSYRTLLDVHGVFPWFFEQHNREGSYKRDAHVELDQRTHVATSNANEFRIEPFTHDIVSAFFFVRTLDLPALVQQAHREGRTDVVRLKHFVDTEQYELSVRVLGRQTVNVPAGTFKCLVIEPVFSQGGLFKREGRILIWLSDDERKIPVKVSTKILIGSVEAELVRFKGLRGPVTAKIEKEKTE